MKLKKIILPAMLMAFLAAPVLAEEKKDDKAMPRAGVERLHPADSDKDGQVTRKEFDAFHAERFKEIDANGDGVLSQDELRSHHESRREYMRERFKDKEGRGNPRMMKDEMRDKMKNDVKPKAKD